MSPTADSRAARKNRIPMKEADFQNLLQGIREAGSYLRGNKKDASRVDHIHPDSVTAIRTKLRLSQKAFSSAFGISPATLRNWEQGRRKPTGRRPRAPARRRETPEGSLGSGRLIALDSPRSRPTPPRPLVTLALHRRPIPLHPQNRFPKTMPSHPRPPPPRRGGPVEKLTKNGQPPFSRPAD